MQGPIPLSAVAAVCLAAVALLIISFLAAKIAGYIAVVASILVPPLIGALQLAARGVAALGGTLGRGCAAVAGWTLARWRGRCSATVTVLPGATLGLAEARELVAALEHAYGPMPGYRVSVVFLPAVVVEGGLRRERGRTLVEIAGGSRSAAEEDARRLWRHVWSPDPAERLAPAATPASPASPADPPRLAAALPDDRPRALGGAVAADPLRPVRRA